MRVKAVRFASFAAIAALAPLTAGLAACAHHDAGSTPTHISQAPVVFDPPPDYPPIVWTGSLEEARARAADEHKPMIVFIRAAWSKPSVTMETTIWQDARILAEASRFVALRIDLTSSYGSGIPDSLKDFDVRTVPMTLIVSSDGQIVGRFREGAARPAEVAAAMKGAK
jgi:thiol:disulfide interchange protein